MGIQEEEALTALDTIEAPEYFYNACIFEDAGDGMVRIIRYVKQRGVLVPAVRTISSAASLIQLGREVTEFARKTMIDHIGDDTRRLPGMKVH